MSPEQIASILWRRKVSFAIAFCTCIAAVVAVTVLLPKTYTATATLYVGGKTAANSFVDTQLLEENTRVYSTLAGNPNIADRVRAHLPQRLSRTDLLDRMSFAPVERTQLLLISAEGSTPVEALRLANTYARTFVRRASQLFALGRTPARIAISEPAALPTKPSKPNPPLYIGLGSLLSLFLALAVALLRERLDTRIRVAPHEDEVLGQPIMARIPRFDSRTAVLNREIRDRFGLLKTNIDFYDEDPARVILVTSPGVNEGKSTVSANLALACAADGERVVLIEADLRRPGLDGTAISQSARRSPVGLSNYLAAAAGEADIVTTHAEHPELSVIWSGLLPPNPTALLGSHRLDTLLDSLRLDFDRIIIDTCPISVGGDASVIAAHVDGVLYIMDEQQTKRSEAQAGLNQLRGVRGRLRGVVLNRATLAGTDGYYYYGERPPDEDLLSGDGAEPARTATLR